jgi:vacuolar-type H+-ATPase subunit E/Vma4
MATANDDMKVMGSVAITMPPLQPSNITVWFALLETQLDTADITSDKVRFATLAKSLDGQLFQQVENVMTDSPATGRYAKLKAELIHILMDSDSGSVKKLVESEEMGDRKPSQFYQHLRKLTSPSTPDEFVR